MSPGPDKQFDRDAALDSAMELFWAKGYTAVGVTELLDDMGVGRQSMYDTFGNKRELFLAALQRYEREQTSTVRSMLEAPGSPMANVRRAFGYWEQLLRGGRGCLVGNSCTELGPQDSEVAELLRHSLQRINRMFVDVLERAKEVGELSEAADPVALASMIVTMGQGVALLSQADCLEVAMSGWNGMKETLASA